MKRVLYYGKLLLIAAVPSVVLPVLFFVLAIYNSSGDRRGVVPAIDNAWGWIGWCGGMPLWLPIMVLSVGVQSLIDSAHAYGYVIPHFDTLNRKTQTDIVLGIGIAANLSLWLLLVASLDWFIRRWKLKHRRA